MRDELPAFAEKLAILRLSQADLAVALLWRANRHEPGAEATAPELGRMMHDLALTGAVNHSRLREQLAAHPDVVRGHRMGAFKLRLGRLQSLDDRYGPLDTGVKKIKVSHALIPEEMTSGTRPYIEALSAQVNGCFELGFYDAAAVLARRLCETLLISAFERANQLSAIRVGNDFMQLSDIIGKAQSGAHIRLARTTARTLEKVKSVGDTAAHNRTYITKREDLSEVAHDLRTALADLMTLAGIQPRRE